jgi:hypothetical protein
VERCTAVAGSAIDRRLIDHHDFEKLKTVFAGRLR